ncbi:putative membrane protein [Mycobacterium kansasii]|uniref:Putative membrane protein n=1 Tax=Mycobacterium kansasii TaxID=1768 RepID=A0A1V3XPB3_MYCKA|nr:putative membrane protein [Mycobacterium kansasii]
MWAVAWIFAAVAVLAVVAHYARKGAVSPRIRNPEVTGVPRPVEPLFGYQHWLGLFQIFTIISMSIIIAVYVVAWRRHPAHPVLLMGIVTTLIVWQDPIMNWAPYAVYNPQLWHWPEDWPLVSLSPTVEPFLVIGYIMFYLGPYFPAIWILRKIQARSRLDSFVWRHPLITLAAIILPVGMLIDAMLEMTLVRTGFYIYSQVIPFGSAFAGQTYQFPFIWETVMVTFVMIPAGCCSTATTPAAPSPKNSPSEPGSFPGSRSWRCSW